MDLPKFDVPEEDPQMDFQKQLLNVLNGAVAPSNSLLQASLETFSLQNNQFKQNQPIPGQEDLMRKLAMAVQGQSGNDVISADISPFVQKLNQANSVEHAESAYMLAALKLRYKFESQFESQIADVNVKMFQKALQLQPNYFNQFLSQFGELTQQDQLYASQIKLIQTKFLQPNFEFLQDYLLEQCPDQPLPADYPGFSLVLIFKDDSQLEMAFRFDQQLQLSDVSSKAVTGAAAELLAVIIKKRNGFFAQLVPFTEGEVQFMLQMNKNAVGQQLQKSLELARAIRAKLMVVL
uniref:Uncharacterized protein n=1 Tax=Trepomonas sp. PC1 TaxID=1076344 RepID=A0A146KCB4_9EUKA|eukprot:JAP93009.1 hypothetical protein TPC1_14867 [Trepomonas sp. PC1]